MVPSNASLHGKGVFTTVAISEGEPFLWEKHWKRLTSNAAQIEIDLSEQSKEAVLQDLTDKIASNAISRGLARITFLDESPSVIWSFETNRTTTLLITADNLRRIPENFKITLSPYKVNSQSPLAGVKSCNYLEKIMGLDEAKARGFDEAIQLNERGEVTSAVMANVFWLREDVLYTPSLETGCLAGTTREFVMENVACREVVAAIDDLAKSEAVFLTSAGVGVVRVATYKSRSFDRIEHPILALWPSYN